jgi:sugar fermentation stimulation protein A
MMIDSEQKKLYKFATPLKEGCILHRPNRFIMVVSQGAERLICHCPATGRIGNIPLEGLPCLLSPTTSTIRKTTHTVEAISLTNGCSWWGINQTAANKYVEFFFRNGLLEKIAPNGYLIQREQKFGNSKLDFRIENTYIEVKTPLLSSPFSSKKPNHLSQSKSLTSSFFERFLRHLKTLEQILQIGKKAIFITCFMRNSRKFLLPRPKQLQNIAISNAVANALKAGLKMWQVNLSIDPIGVKLINYLDITTRILCK